MSFIGIVEAIAAPILGPVFSLIDQAVVDKDLATRLKADIQMAVLRIQEKTLDAQKDIIVAEANSQSWLPRNIRPLFLLTLLVGMAFSIVAGAFGYGDAVANGWSSIPQAGWSLMQIGLGGYIAGRTIEKVAPGALVNAATTVANVVKNPIPRWKRDKDWQNK